MNGIVAKLVKAHYVVHNEGEIETLARERYTSNAFVGSADGTYLRVILVAAQAQLGRPRRGSSINTEAQFGVLDAVHEKFYAAVMRGVTTPDVEVEPGLDPAENRRRSLERNSRSAFARSAASTLRGYITAGGDLRALDASTVTKRAIRAAFEPKPADSGDRIARQIANATGALVKAIGRRARDNPEEARQEVEAVMDELQKVLDSLDGDEQEEPEAGATTVVSARPRDTGPARTRVGIPQLHRGVVS